MTSATDKMKVQAMDSKTMKNFKLENNSNFTEIPH